MEREQDDVICLLDESLRKARSHAPSPESLLRRPRSTSSSYPAEGIKSSRMQSPVSSYGNGRRLSLSNLSQFGDGADDLIRRSSSTSSRRRASSNSGDSNKAASETASSSVAWRRQRDPVLSYGRFELLNSDESEPAPTPFGHIRITTEKPPSYRSKPPTLSETSDRTHASAHSTRTQYDGPGETSNADSPDPFARPSSFPVGSKRKASQFSLASITKRPRLSIKRWALKLADKMKHRRDEGRRHFAQWRARREESKQMDTPELKAEKNISTFSDAFSIEKGRKGHEDWWIEGVKKYRAPTWIKFHHASMP